MNTKKKNPYVNEQPNMEDLMCAGISSGPAKFAKLNIKNSRQHNSTAHKQLEEQQHPQNNQAGRK